MKYYVIMDEHQPTKYEFSTKVELKIFLRRLKENDHYQEVMFIFAGEQLNKDNVLTETKQTKVNGLYQPDYIFWE